MWALIEEQYGDDQLPPRHELLAIGDRYVGAGHVEQAVIAYALAAARDRLAECGALFAARGDLAGAADAAELAGGEAEPTC